MIAIFKREIKNYLKRPLFWVGILLVIYGVFNTTSPYLMTHYLGQGEKIVNDYPDTVRLGDVYEGYIPANPEKHREIWSGQIKQALIDELEMSDLEAQSVMSELVDMELEEAFVYLEEKYDWYSARYMYEDSAYYKGTSEEINAYLNEKMKNKTFSFYYSRKFADFAGLFMCFFATIMLAVLFLQDTKKHTYELLHTKPITAGKYVLGKVSAGFAICLIALTIINLLFWALCVIYTKDSGFEVRFWDFIVSTVLYILPNMLMIVSVYTLISLLFKNPLPGVPLLILYMVYSNMGGRNAEGVYGYWGRPFAIMVRFPDQLFDTTPPPMAFLNQSLLILAWGSILCDNLNRFSCSCVNSHSFFLLFFSWFRYLLPCCPYSNASSKTKRIFFFAKFLSCFISLKAFSNTSRFLIRSSRLSQVISCVRPVSSSGAVM